MVKTSQEERQAKGREALKASAPPAEKAPNGVKCEGSCAQCHISLPSCCRHSGITCPLHGLDISVNAAWEEQGNPTLACFSNPPTAAHSQGEAQTVHAKLNHCKTHPKLWPSPLGMDRQTGKYKPSAKVYPPMGRGSKNKLDPSRREATSTSTQLFFVCVFDLQ